MSQGPRLCAGSAPGAPRLGWLAGLVASAAGEAVASVTHQGRSPVSGLARGLVDASPAKLVDGGVGLVGTADKPGLAVIAATVSAAAAVAGARLARQRPVLGAAVAAAPHALGGLLAVRLGDASPRDTAAATLTATAVAAAAVIPACPSARVRAGVTAIAVTGALLADRSARRRDAAQRHRAVALPPPARPLPPLPTDAARRHRGVAPVLAEPGQLSVIDITVPEPRVDLERWRLTVDGEVTTSLSLSLAELLALPLQERDLLMVCVHNPVGGPRMGCARWTGLPLADLLDRAGVPEDAASDTGRWLVAEAVDGYTNVLPLATARAHGFVALGMAGQPLPREHGSPARILLPGRHGQDGNLKWLHRLTVTTTEPLSYWGRRGWRDGTYPVHPASRVDAPGDHHRVPTGSVTVRGYAWAPPVGIDAVQLQVDDGPWTDATLGIDLGPAAWRPWSATWQATSGAHRLRVRCHTIDGRWQETSCTTPYPHGVRGIHQVTVHVGAAPVLPGLRRVAATTLTRLSWARRSIRAWRQPVA